MASSKNYSPQASLKSSQLLLPHAAAMPKAATAIAMVATVDVIVGVAVNVASGQQAQLLIQAQAQKARAKQNPVKKAVVAVAMAAPSALRSHALMQTPQAQNQAMLHLQPIAI